MNSARRLLAVGIVGWAAVFLVFNNVSARQRVATPTISPSGGTFTDAVTVTLSTDTAGATLKYRLNGGESLIYTDPLTLTQTTTVEAKAFKSGYQASLIAWASFTITVSQNQPPTVSAGEDQTLGWNIVATLEGSVTDDSLPSPATITWSDVSGSSGPAPEGMPIVKFSDPSSATTAALFPLPGTYVLRLTADDTEYQVSDEVTIEVPKNYAIGNVMDVADATLENVPDFVEEIARIQDELGISLFGQSFPESSTPDVWDAYLDAVRDAGGKLMVWFEDDPPVCGEVCQAEGDWELGINGTFLQAMAQTPHPALQAFFLIDEPYHDKHGLINGEPGEYVVTSTRLQHLYQQAKAIAPDVPFHVNFSKEITEADDLCELNSPDYPESECEYDYQYVAGICDTTAISGLEFRQNLQDQGGPEDPTYQENELIHNNTGARKVVMRETQSQPDALALYSSVQVFGDNDPDTSYTYYMPSATDLKDMLDVLRCPNHPDPARVNCAQVVDVDHPENGTLGDAGTGELSILGFQRWDGVFSNLKDPEFADLRAVVKETITGQGAPIVHACPEANRDEQGLCQGEQRQQVVLPNPAVLDATVTYNGSEILPEHVIPTWSVLEGRGTVTFDNPNAVDTTAHFELGDTDAFILRLTVSDGLLSTSDDVEIDVPKDTAYPYDVTITAINGAPAADGQIVSDTITVEAEAKDDVGITFVEFQVEGGAIHYEARSVETLTTWTTDGDPFSWDTTGEIDEEYNLKVRAYDAEGNALSSDRIKVTVSNDVPIVTIDNPQEGDAVPQPSKTISVTATDSGEIATIAVYDGSTLVALSADPIANPLIWTTSALAQGSSHTLIAEATDVTGKTGVSSPVTVTIKDTDPPDASITSPSDGSAVSGSVIVHAAASDNVAISRVALLVDGVVHGDADEDGEPYELTLDTSGLTEGEDYNLKVRAYDTSDNFTTSEIVEVIVRNDATPPTVVFTYQGEGGSTPPDGSIVASGSRPLLTATASDLYGVDRVDYYVNGTLEHTERIVPYEYRWQVPTSGPTDYTLEVRAYDEASNMASDVTHVTRSP